MKDEELSILTLPFLPALFFDYPFVTLLFYIVHNYNDYIFMVTIIITHLLTL